MATKSDLRKVLKQMQHNLNEVEVLKRDGFLHLGIDEGGLIGSPTVFVACRKEAIPENLPYVGQMHTAFIKKYLTSLFFTWVVFGLPDYSNITIQTPPEGL